MESDAIARLRMQMNWDAHELLESGITHLLWYFSLAWVVQKKFQVELE